MIAAISCVRNEEDIIETNVRHLLAEGVDLMLVLDHSEDRTSAILHQIEKETGKVEVLIDHNDEAEYRQDVWMNELAAIAHDKGADWILPFDADEFWFAPGHTLKYTLENAPAPKLYATLWHHIDWDHKVVPAERLPKVAYRYSPDAVLTLGAHDVSIAASESGLLEVRHLQYRSFEHFCAKVADVAPRVPVYARERGDSTHLTRLQGFCQNEMRREWDVLCGRETVHDPIPIPRPS